MKFGDMVSPIGPGGTFMVVGPYTGKRYAKDPEGPAVWMADIDTDWQASGEPPMVTWASEQSLVLMDELE